MPSTASSPDSSLPDGSALPSSSLSCTKSRMSGSLIGSLGLIRALSGKRSAPTPKPKAKPRQKPKPRGIASGQRVFAWPRYPGAVYYQFYFQRGTRTIFQGRTVRPRAELPASLKVLPGVYRVLVRPAIPGDAGIILGPVIVTRTVRV